MRVLVSYDVSTVDLDGRRRLRLASKACKSFGARVQYSMFECSLAEKDWVRLRARLLDIVRPAHDSLRVYFLDADTRVEHHGVREPVDLDGPLVV